MGWVRLAIGAEFVLLNYTALPKLMGIFNSTKL